MGIMNSDQEPKTLHEARQLIRALRENAAAGQSATDPAPKKPLGGREEALPGEVITIVNGQSCVIRNHINVPVASVTETNAYQQFQSALEKTKDSLVRGEICAEIENLRAWYGTGRE